MIDLVMYVFYFESKRKNACPQNMEQGAICLFIFMSTFGSVSVTSVATDQAPCLSQLSKLSMLCRSVPGSIVNFVSLEFGVIIDIACALAPIEAFVHYSLSKFMLFQRWICLRFLACFFSSARFYLIKSSRFFFLLTLFFLEQISQKPAGGKYLSFCTFLVLCKIHLYMQIRETDFMICF